METSERKFRIIGNTLVHGFKNGTIVKMYDDDNGSDIPSMIGIDKYGDAGTYWVPLRDMEEITNQKPSIPSRLYTAIAGALFGSYHRDRYQDGEQ